MWKNRVKAWVFLTAISVLLVWLGHLVAGPGGALLALLIAAAFNFAQYYYSDRLVLAAYGAVPLEKAKYPEVYQIAEELSERAGMPIPKLWLVRDPVANAFATGRNANHASVAFTTGILELLDQHELRGVMAHELSHVINSDILVGTVAATMAAAIAYLVDMVRYTFFWGGEGDRIRKMGIGQFLAITFMIPMAAFMLKLALTRSREYMADETGARLSCDPMALASALEKLEQQTVTHHLQNRDTSFTKDAITSLCICQPFTSKDFFSNLFSTHPPMAKRILALRNMKI